MKFEVELLSWAEAKKERWEMSASEKLTEARKLKDEGGVMFKAGELESAHGKYLSAEEWVMYDYDFVPEADKIAARDIRAACLLNATQCSLKLQEWPDASSSCTKALGVEGLPEMSKVKALFRRGSARIKMAEFADARERPTSRSPADPSAQSRAVLTQRPARAQALTCWRLASWTRSRRKSGKPTRRSKMQRLPRRRRTRACLLRWSRVLAA